MELLKQLYNIHSHSGKEDEMRKFIMAWAKQHKLNVKKDRKGNVYVVKGKSETYPCIVAHMDEVHAVRPAGFKVVVYKDNYILGGDADILRPVGIGADDKNGIWCALRLLERIDAMKAVFFVEEEVGCHGSRLADMSFFNDCRFVLQADRRGGGDFINSASSVELCNSQFIEKMKLKTFGYKCASGMMTDVLTLKENGLAVCCANISCGYYNPHTPDEYTNFAELENCLAFIEHAFVNITDVCPHKRVEKYDVGYQSRGMKQKYPFWSAVDDLPDDDEVDHVNVPSSGMNGYGSAYMRPASQW